MQKFLLGRKIGMTQLVDDEGNVYPVSLVQVDEGVVLGVKPTDLGGKCQVYLGFQHVEESALNRAEQGKCRSFGKGYFKVLRQLTLSSGQTDGGELSVNVFEEGEKVHVRGVSIGRGFAGTIRRWNFRRGPMSHGSKSHRITGSIGGGTTPGRVTKGKKMPGHMGARKVTLRNLKIVRIDGEKRILFLKGGVPGKQNGLVEIFN